MDIKQFGNEILKELLEGDSEEIKILRKQFENSNLKKFEYTGHGFFIHYVVDPDEEMIDKRNVEIGGLCRINDSDELYDIILFIRGGFIDFLEGSVFGNGNFPKEISSYEFEPLEDNIEKLKKFDKK